jgi:hypothetical protein
LGFLDWDSVGVDFFERLNVVVLHESSELGLGGPVFLSGSTTASWAATTSTTATASAKSSSTTTVTVTTTAYYRTTQSASAWSTHTETTRHTKTNCALSSMA